MSTVVRSNEYRGDRVSALMWRRAGTKRNEPCRPRLRGVEGILEKVESSRRVKRKSEVLRILQTEIQKQEPINIEQNGVVPFAGVQQSLKRAWSGASDTFCTGFPGDEKRHSASNESRVRTDIHRNLRLLSFCHKFGALRRDRSCRVF